MTSTSFFKDTLTNDTQVLLNIKDSFFEISLYLINPSFTPYFLTSSTLSWHAGTSKEIPPGEKRLINTRNTTHFLISIFFIQLLR